MNKKAGSIFLSASAMAAANMFRVAIQIIILPVVGRLLGPEVYGEIALVSPFIFFAMLLAESGLGACLIRAPEASPALQGTIFSFSASFSLAVILLFGLLAHPIGTLMHEPAFPPLLIGMSCILFLSSFNIVPAGLLLRHKRYGWIALSDVVSTGFSLAGVGLGIYLGWGAWSLVAQQMALWVGKVAIVTWGAKWRPRLTFSKALFLENIYFGSNLTGAEILSFIAKNIDNLLIGSYLGTLFLGYYALAFQIVGLPGAVLSGSVYYMVFSATSEAVRANRYSGDYFIRILRSTVLLGAPMMAGIAAIAPLAIPFLLGEKWLAATSLIALLSPMGLCLIIGAPTYGVIMGFGRADTGLRLGLIVSLLTIAAIIAGVFISSAAVAGGVSLTAVIGCWLALRVLVKEYGVTWKDVSASILVPLAASLVMGGGVYAFQTFIATGQALPLRLLLSIAVGVVLYAALMFGIFKNHMTQDLETIGSLLKAKFARIQ